MKNLIALYGGSGVGKSLTAKLIQYQLPNYKIIAFGDIIKRVAEVVYHIPFDRWQERGFKNAHRYLLDNIGTALRGIDKNTIIDALLTGIQGNNIISDVRTLREVWEVKSHGGILVRIKRDIVEPDETIEMVPDEMFDYVLDNNFGIMELEKNIEIMLDELKLK